MASTAHQPAQIRTFLFLLGTLSAAAFAQVAVAQRSIPLAGASDKTVAINAPAATVQQDATQDGFKVFPITSDVMYSVSSELPTNEADATDSAGTVVEKLIYDNPLGRFAISPQAGQLVADDLTLSVKSGCPLTGYRFQIIGKAIEAACGGVTMTCGPLRVDFALIDECPSAGGLEIAGTTGCASTVVGATTPQGEPCIFLPDADARTDIDFIPTAPVPVPSRVWLAVTMSRDNAGVVVGAPALAGFSDDVLDTIGFPCNTSLGVFPARPHASFNASVYGDATCGDAHPTYQNVLASATGINAGSFVCMAEDITLNGTCTMSEMEVAVRGLGRYDVEIRQRTTNGKPEGFCNGFNAFGGPSSIPGSRFAFVNQASDLKVFRKTFDPPIVLPATNLFAVMMGNSPLATWVLTRHDATIGSTQSTYYTFSGDVSGGTWNLAQVPGGVTAGFHLTITCDGPAPVGACCDPYFRDDFGEAVCRDVPEINCAFPGKDSDLRPAWEEGVSCRVCEGGDRDLAACDGDAACPGGVCVDNHPFLLPCGVAACCRPDGSCINLTLNECNTLSPIYGGMWNLGQYCGSQGQVCPIPECAQTEGDCLQPRQRLCSGGPNDGQSCLTDDECAADPLGLGDGTCPALPVPLCSGGDHDGMACANDFDCIPGGVCAAAVCVGGAHAGGKCEFDRDCKEVTCQQFTGCTDSVCCTKVCNYSLGAPYHSEFCCQVEWDQTCADMAAALCENVTPSNATCAPQAGSPGETGALEIKVNGLSVSTDNTRATDPALDPICCNGGQRRCVGGSDDGAVCADDLDCVGDGTGAGFCGDAQPEPGTPGVGSVWYFFTVPDGPGETLDVTVSTCGSASPATDSMLQAYAIRDNDSGVCSDTGTCAGDGSLCSTVTRFCADGTNCNAVNVFCSISEQNCPLGAACVLNKIEACNTLTLIGCNDDAPDGCGDSTQMHNSKLCLPNLRRGDTYFVLLAAKSEATRGKYTVSVRSTSSCESEQTGTCIDLVCVGGASDGVACVDNAECAVAKTPLNDFCPFATDLVDLDGDNAITQRFDVGTATQDCRAPSCLGNLRNDVWYRYEAPASGELLVTTCGGSNDTTPDTELIIYDGCECGAGVLSEITPDTELCCSATGDPFACLGGSDCDIRVVAGNCYLMRLGDNSGTGARGDMKITLIPDPGCPAGTVTWNDPPSGTVDARYPRDCTNGGSPLGIDTFHVTGPLGAASDCWSICEGSAGGPQPNSIALAIQNAPGEYTITLTRPITPGACTTITYDEAGTGGPPQTAKFSSLPADVNGDGTAGPADILDLIDILNGNALAVWGAYSTDVDVSGATSAPDILAVIDLLNGAGCFAPWNANSIETGHTCGTCPIAAP